MFACTVSHQQAEERPDPLFDPLAGTLDLGYRGLRRFSPEEYFSDAGRSLRTLQPADGAVHLRKLLITNNSLTELPSGESMPYLEYLDVSYNSLTQIPFYPRLVDLIASHNQIRRLDEYRGTATLSILDLSNNPLRSVPVINLSELYLDGTPIDFLSLEEYPGLQCLTMRESKIRTLGGTSELVDLDVSGTALDSLPSLRHMQYLKIDRTAIASLPILPSLLQLSCEDAPLKSVRNASLTHLWGSKSITEVTCPRLTHLYLSGCTSLRLDAPRLIELEAIDCSILTLPRLDHLETLDLSHGGVQELILPDSIYLLSVRHNPLRRLSFYHIEGSTRRELYTLTMDWSTYRNVWKDIKIRALNLHQDGELLRQNAAGRLTSSELQTFLTLTNVLRIEKVEETCTKIALSIFKHRYHIGSYGSVQQIYQTDKFRKIFRLVSKLYSRCVWVNAQCQH